MICQQKKKKKTIFKLCSFLCKLQAAMINHKLYKYKLLKKMQR